MVFGRVLRAQPQNSVLVLLGQGRRVVSGLSVSCPLFHTHTTVPKITLTSKPDWPKKNLLGFDQVSSVNPSKPGCESEKLMAASASIVNNSFTRSRDVSYSTKATMRLCSRVGSGLFMIFNSNNPLVRPLLKGLHISSSSRCYSDAVVPDGSLYEEQIVNCAVSPHHQNSPGERTLKLLSGSCYLPHPDKEETGGEDAHFICVDEQAIGIADGVGGWADVGVNAGVYARELMLNSVAEILEQSNGLINPFRVLEKAHSITKSKGSSTACIIVLTDQVIHAINLGDSGFIVVRDGCTIFQTPVQQHGFNFPYQLESGNGADLPSSGQVFEFPVTTGDVIVAGTDGLFDNLYNNEITAVVAHAVKGGLSPQVTAQKITALARQRALDKTRQTPFSTAAQEAEFRYFGGKLDDVTVVVSYITGSANT